MTALPNPNPVTMGHLSLFRGQCQLSFSDIVYVEAQGNYAVFQCGNGKRIMTCKPLRRYESLLPHDLIRVHKSHFVNLAFIIGFERNGVLLANGKCIAVSRRRRREVRQLVKTRLKNSIYFPNALSA